MYFLKTFLYMYIFIYSDAFWIPAFSAENAGIQNPSLENVRQKCTTEKCGTEKAERKRYSKR